MIARLASQMTDTGTLMSQVAAYLNDESGASAAEYATILAIVGSALAVSAIFLGSVIASALNSAGTCISTAGGNC
jgi:pilus assembly protein Flp/PilA